MSASTNEKEGCDNTLDTGITTIESLDNSITKEQVQKFIENPGNEFAEIDGSIGDKHKCDPVTAKEGDYYHNILYGELDDSDIPKDTPKDIPKEVIKKYLKFPKILDKRSGCSSHYGFREFEKTYNKFAFHMAVHKNCRTIREESSKKEDKENTWTFKKQLNEHNLEKLLKGGAGLLEEFGKFLETYIEKDFEKDFELEFEKIQNDEGNPIDFKELTEKLNEKEITGEQSPTPIMFKQLFCFASKTYDELPEDVKKGGSPDDSDDEEQPVAAPGAVSIFSSVSPTRRRIMWIITFMAYMYFLFVAIENFRLLINGINQVLDYRQQYLLDVDNGGGEDIADTGYGSYISGFFNVMYEGAMGTLLNTIMTYQGAAVERIQHSFAVAASYGGRSTWQACNDSFFNCVNQYLTGDLTNIAQSTGMDALTYESNRAMNDAIHEVRTQYTQLTNNFTSVSNGIVTSINGLICSTILLGHMISPETYPAALVYSSMGSLMPIYSSGTSIYGLYLTMQNFGILLRPRQVIAAARAATGLTEPPAGEAEAAGPSAAPSAEATPAEESVVEEEGNTTDGGSPEAAPVVEAEPVSKGILGTIINLMGGKKGKTPKQKKRKNAKRSLKKMKRKSRSSR